MLTDAEKRAAAWVVSRYGLDPAQIERIIARVLRSRGQGKKLNFFDALLGEKLLAPGLVHDLRLALDETRVDPQDAEPKNHAKATRPGGAPEAATIPPAPAPNGADASVPDLRAVGPYRILRRLGEGGMGAVFLGYRESGNEYVAIKVLGPQLARNQELLRRFQREAKSGAHLNHPNIVRNLGMGYDETAEVHYLLMEYIDGPSAQDLLERHGQLFVADAVHLILDIARALEHAHSRNLIHRDIKPGNILVTSSGMAKLSDMGLAKRTDEASHITHHRQGFGTPYYMPYEQALNAKYADARSDLYALGATLYHLVVGEVPFKGANALEIVEKKNLGIFTPASVLNPDVPAVLDHILTKLLARERADRYQTASELIVDLTRSNLAASVPSFIDPDKALADPLMRQRLLTSPPVTEHDLGRADAPMPDWPPLEDAAVWYLRYRDRDGHLCKAKLTHAQLVQRWRQGTLPESAEASRNAQGDFQPLSEIPDLTVLVRPSTAVAGRPPSRPAQRRLVDHIEESSTFPTWMAPVLGSVAILLIIVITVVVLLIGLGT